MMKFTKEELRKIMDKKNNIRNMSVIAHLHHGKSMIIDCLVAAAGTSTHVVAGDVPTTDAQGVETDYRMTTKSTAISLFHEMSDELLQAYKGELDGNEFLINLIDTPGHLEFSYEVSAALRISDGALVVVDCFEGVSAQTETLLRQALGERIKPVLTVNMIDKCFLDPTVTGEETYQTIFRIIQSTNSITATCKDSFLGDVQVDPVKGTVAFSSGLHGWAFTLKDFTKFYASRYGKDESNMMRKMWGDYFIDLATNKWSTQYTANCERGFVNLCYKPIQMIMKGCMSDDKEKLWTRLGNLGVTMKTDEKELTGEALIKCVMQKWLPASRALLDMSVYHLPSPLKAQNYRVDSLYEGPLNDKYAMAIRNCDPEGPLMLYVSKMIPASNKGSFFAFGRVFSGKLATGMKIRIMGPSYVSGKEDDVYVNSVQQTLTWIGPNEEFLQDIPCGNIMAMLSLDEFIPNSATVADKKEVNAYPIRAMKSSVAPLVCVTVRCQRSANLPKLKNCLKYLENSYPTLILTILESDSSCIIAGAGELHLQICLNDLKVLMGRAKVIISPFGAVFRETVIDESSHTVICNFVNKSNEIHMKALPLQKEVMHAIDNGLIGPDANLEVRSKVLSEDFGWDKDAVENIWSFGPETMGPNMVVDMRKEGKHEIKDLIVTGFQLASAKGTLAEENMRGIRFDVWDVALNPNATRRGVDNEIVQAARNAAHGSQLAAKPRLLEPVYLVDIEAPKDVRNAVKAALNMQGANVFEEILMLRPGTPLYKIRAYLAVQDSFGFSSALRRATYGQAAISGLNFDHWELVNSNPLEHGSLASSYITEIRGRKGLN